MRTPEFLHLPDSLHEAVDDAEELASKAMHVVAHEADRALDLALRPLTIDVGDLALDDADLDDLEGLD